MFVTAFMFDVLPTKFEEVTDEAKRFVQQHASAVPGLIEIAVMGNEDKTQVLVLTRWESKAAWGESRWDTVSGKALTKLVESSKTFDVRSFVPLEVLEVPQKPS